MSWLLLLKYWTAAISLNFFSNLLYSVWLTHDTYNVKRLKIPKDYFNNPYVAICKADVLLHFPDASCKHN